MESYSKALRRNISSDDRQIIGYHRSSNTYHALIREKGSSGRMSCDGEGLGRSRRPLETRLIRQAGHRESIMQELSLRAFSRELAGKMPMTLDVRLRTHSRVSCALCAGLKTVAKVPGCHLNSMIFYLELTRLLLVVLPHLWKKAAC
jgi:hypothetical protein